MAPRYQVRWYVAPGQDIHAVSSLITGLGALASAREIELNVAPLGNGWIESLVVRLDVHEIQTGRTCRVAFDCYDRADRFDFRTLDDVDVYFKQTLDRHWLATLPGGAGSKVHAGGLTFSARVRGSRRWLGRAAVSSYVSLVALTGPGQLLAGIRRLWGDAQVIRGILYLDQWEQSPGDHAGKRVVYQSRIWPPEPGVDRREINDFRTALVRELRRALGNGDLIGLIDTTFARQVAPDAILTRKVTRKEYARQLRTSLISVNSHGLDGSPGFKIGESLAAGAALVSQPLLFELPEPLLPEIHYLPYESPSECVAQCRRLLDDSGLAQALRAANRDYYRRHVRPDAFARRLLDRAFELIE